jgi:hypothetical protein
MKGKRLIIIAVHFFRIRIAAIGPYLGLNIESVPKRSPAEFE